MNGENIIPTFLEMLVCWGCDAPKNMSTASRADLWESCVSHDVAEDQGYIFGLLTHDEQHWCILMGNSFDIFCLKSLGRIGRLWFLNFFLYRESGDNQSYLPADAL